MTNSTYNQSNWRVTIWVVSYIVSMVVIATAFGYMFEQEGMPRWIACFLGAYVGFCMVSSPLFVYGRIQVSRMRRSSGFPFADGQRVEIANGPREGEQGYIRFRGQVETQYYVVLDGRDPKTECLVINHKDLRSVERLVLDE